MSGIECDRMGAGASVAASTLNIFCSSSALNGCLKGIRNFGSTWILTFKYYNFTLFSIHLGNNL